MAPEPDPEFAAACARRWPALRVTGALPARKSQLLTGELDGVAVVAKRLARPNDVWAWYFTREVAIYRAFAAAPPPFRAPRLIAVDDEILLVEHAPGAPLARRRRPAAALAAGVLDALLATCAQIAAWPGTFPRDLPPPPVLSELRRRFLEDPTAPAAWVRDGIARAARTGILDDAAARAIDAAIPGDIAPCHGDLLLRNAYADGETVTLVDWECAGPHLAGWDRALVWIQLADAGRTALEQRVADVRALHGLAAFALVREIAIVRAFGGADGELVAALAALVTRL